MKTVIRVCAFLLLLIFMAATSFASNGFYEKALEAYRKKDFKTAAELLKKHIAERPDPKAYYLLGYASYKLKRHTESAEYFKEAYLIDPDFNPETVKAEIKEIAPKK